MRIRMRIQVTKMMRIRIHNTDSENTTCNFLVCRYISDCGKGRKVSDLLARFTLADVVRSPHPPVPEVVV
jgi:hypothetical protein